MLVEIRGPRARRRRRQRWVSRILGVIVVVLCVLGFGLIAHYYLPQWSGSSPVTVAPTPAVSVHPTPTPSATTTRTPSPTPTASSAPRWEDWTFTWATLSVANPDAKMQQVPIHQRLPEEYVANRTITNSQGQEVLAPSIDPIDKHSITLDRYEENGTYYPVGCALSATSANTCYAYCHSYRDKTAVCSFVYDALQPGDQITIETATEVLTYALQEKFDVFQGDVSHNQSLGEIVPGRFVLFTCLTDGGGEVRNDAGEPIVNGAMVFQLVGSVTK